MQFSYDITPKDLTDMWLERYKKYRFVFFWGPVLYFASLLPTIFEGGLPRSVDELFYRYSGDLVASWLPFAIFIVVYGLIFRHIIVPIGLKRQCNQNPLAYSNLTLAADEQSIRIQDSRSVSTWMWSDFMDFRNKPRIFLLYLSESVQLIVPKRDLSEAEMDGFRSLLESRIRLRR